MGSACHATRCIIPAAGPIGRPSDLIGPCWSVMASVHAVWFALPANESFFLLGRSMVTENRRFSRGQSVAGVPQLAWVATRTRDPTERAGVVTDRDGLGLRRREAVGIFGASLKSSPPKHPISVAPGEKHLAGRFA